MTRKWILPFLRGIFVVGLLAGTVLIGAPAQASTKVPVVLKFSVAPARNEVTDSNLTRERILDMYRESEVGKWKFVGLVSPCYQEKDTVCRSPYEFIDAPLPALGANEAPGRRPYWRFVFDSLPPGRYAFSEQQHFRLPQRPVMKSKIFTIR
jgi:hypothetical protein